MPLKHLLLGTLLGVSMNKSITHSIAMAACFSLASSTYCSTSSGYTTADTSSWSIPWRTVGTIGLAVATLPLSYVSYATYSKLKKAHEETEAATQDETDVAALSTRLTSSIQNKKKDDEAIRSLEKYYTDYKLRKATAGPDEFDVIQAQYATSYADGKPVNFATAFDELTLHEEIALRKNTYSRQKMKFGASLTSTLLCGGGSIGLLAWSYFSKK
jgi:hypothetical protein